MHVASWVEPAFSWGNNCFTIYSRSYVYLRTQPMLGYDLCRVYDTIGGGEGRGGERKGGEGKEVEEEKVDASLFVPNFSSNGT